MISVSAKQVLSTVLVSLIVLTTPACGLFKKKCDCPDLRRSKRIAAQPVNSDQAEACKSNLSYLRPAV